MICIFLQYHLLVLYIRHIAALFKQHIFYMNKQALKLHKAGRVIYFEGSIVKIYITFYCKEINNSEVIICHICMYGTALTSNALAYGMYKTKRGHIRDHVNL